MLVQRGVPQLFLTINPCPQHSPIFQVIYGDMNVNLDDRYPNLVLGKERAERLARDPVAASDFFDFSIRCIFEDLFGWNYAESKSSEEGGILGKLDAFYGTTEFTERGTLHGHFLLWLKGGLNPSEVHKRLSESTEYQSKFFEFFDSIIHTQLPEIDMDDKLSDIEYELE